HLLDINVRTDYGRIRRLLFTPEGAPRTNLVGTFETVLADGSIDAPLKTSFPLDLAYDDDYFVSLLYYLGLLTLQPAEDGWFRLGIPNYAVRTLYWETIARLLHDLADAGVDRSRVRAAIHAMAR